MINPLQPLIDLVNAFLDWLRNLFEKDEGGDMGTWQPEELCRDFEKVTLQFAGKTITVNRQYAAQFTALDTWIKINNMEQYVTRVDSFACRHIRGGRSWSYHSYGQAIDINPDDFPMRTERYTLPQWYTTLIDIAKTIGFRSGRDWQSIYDPMHLEIGTRLPRGT